MMHHSDLDLDVTSGVRFHPVEITLSLAVKAMAIMAVGASPLAVLILEIVLNATSLFNHSNVAMPQGLERLLRWIVVTPDMHRAHHSKDVRETNSNYGFNVPWWDRLFGTYCPEPTLGHLDMNIGLEHLDPTICLNLFGMLRFPFVTTLLERKELKIEGPFGEPDERDGNDCQRSAGEHQSGVRPGAADQVGQW